MTILVATLLDIRMPDHDKKCDTIWYFPLVFVTNIGIVFSSLDIYLKGKSSTLFPCFHIFDEADTELVPLSAVDRRLYDTLRWE